MLHFKHSVARALCALAFLPVAIFLIAGAQSVFSQTTTSSIHGTVTDGTGAVVPDAKVTALNTSTGITVVATTNRSGYYLFPSLQPGGPYTVIIEANGFDKYESKGISLSVNANWDADAKLKVGTNQQTVTVDANGVQVETSNTQLEQDINSDQIENLPLLGRDASGLQKLAPGAVESSDRFGNYSTNGSQTTSDSFLLNGTDINDGPLQSEGLAINPDALQEENIVSSTLNPEFARNGGAVINQVVKAGTNNIHGSGFEYYRDTFLNNGNYFSQTRPPFHQNLYGGTVGGPIKKEKAFLFLAYQGYHNRTGSTQQTAVFQSGVVSDGNFTNDNNIAQSGLNGVTGLSTKPIPFQIATANGNCGPGTANTTWAKCFPASAGSVIIPTSNFNPIALKLVQTYVPAGNATSANGAPLYNFNTANSGTSDQGIVRADYHFTDRDQVWGSFIFQSSPQNDSLPFTGSDLPGFAEINAAHSKIYSATYTHTFSTTAINELRAGYYRFNYAAVEPATPVQPSSVGFDITPQTSSSGLPYIGLTGLFSLGFSTNGPQPRKDTNISGTDVFSKTIGNHNLKFGATVEQFRVSNPFYANNNGSFGFGGAGQYSSGDPAIDFLLGIPDSYAQTSGGFVDAESWEYYAFAQDSWKVSSDLTVNYGLAWDVETPNTNSQFGGIGITCFQVGSATSKIFPGGFPGLLFPGDPGCNKQGGASTKYAHFGPRVGFDWSPSKGPKAIIGGEGEHAFAIRGGFGIYYNRDQEEGQLQNLGDVPNFKNSQGAADFQGSPSFANPFTDVAGNGSEANPFPFVRPKAGTALNWANYVPQDISAIDPNYTTPYIYNFNLNIQRQLPGKLILEVGYVGSIGRKLATTFESDPITAAGHTACLENEACDTDPAQQHLFYPANTAQPVTFGDTGFPDYISVGTLATRGASSYHSLQASLNKALSHGLYFTVAYTFSHGLDNASGLESSGFGAKSKNNVPGYEYLSYGDSDYDARHRLSLSYDYTIPLLPSMNNNFVVKELLGSWHFNGVSAFQTGFPINLSDAGAYDSLWCDAYSYYGCPDTPNTTSFHIPSLSVRKTGTWFSTAPFSGESTIVWPDGSIGAGGQFGNVKRNFFHGPGYNYTNLSVYKLFPVGKDSARSIQIAMQASNAFNHANFAGPDSNYTDGPFFGTVTSVKGTADANGDPSGGRTVQLVGKFRF